ncbi:hypothetical protein B0T14DRAFT_525726, partial [Immersiella caudata]
MGYNLVQDKGSLTDSERRGFNSLTILISALLSITIGSLFGLLGNMLRWRLLASKSHTPRDVGSSNLDRFSKDVDTIGRPVARHLESYRLAEASLGPRAYLAALVNDTYCWAILGDQRDRPVRRRRTRLGMQP